VCRCFPATVRDPSGVGMVSCGARCPGVFAPLAALRPPATVHDPSGVAPPPAGRAGSALETELNVLLTTGKEGRREATVALA
jgi:hypothetical protein